jgi:hypothetical protein
MIIQLRRSTVFKTSHFANAFIAQLQQSYAADLDSGNKAQRILLSRYYDNLKPLGWQQLAIDGHCVMAFPAASQEEYFLGLQKGFDQLFTLLEVAKIYFLDFLNTPLSSFPFENFAKRNQFKRLTGSHPLVEAFAIKSKDIGSVLPLFYFSKRFERASITLIADGDLPFALRLCKDGNFHINYQIHHQTLVQTAAITAGFKIGDVDLCWEYKIHCLPKLSEASVSE